MWLKPLTLVLTILGATAAPAFALCPSLPDGPDSQQVQNGQQRALCLQQELHDNTVDRNDQVQFQGLKNSFEQFQIEQRFDQLPTFSPSVPPVSNN